MSTSILGLGLIVSGNFVGHSSDLGLIMAQIGLAIVLWVPFQKLKYSVPILGILFFVYNLANYYHWIERIQFYPLLTWVIWLSVILGSLIRIASTNKDK